MTDILSKIPIDLSNKEPSYKRGYIFGFKYGLRNFDCIFSIKEINKYFKTKKLNPSIYNPYFEGYIDGYNDSIYLLNYTPYNYNSLSY